MSFKKLIEDAKEAFQRGKYFACAELLKSAIADQFEQAQSDDERAEAHLELGRVLQKLADFDQSEKHLCAAKDLYLKKNEGQKSFEYSEVLKVLGLLFFERVQYKEANELLMQALTIREALFQPPHKDLAEILARLGELHWKKGDNNAANSYLDRALSMYKDCVGDDHEDYANALEDKCLVMQNLGQVEEAEVGLRKCLDIRQRRLADGHPLLANSWSNLAFVLGKRNRREGTDEMIKRAIEIATNSYGEFNPHTATFINNLGGYYLDSGELKEAARHFEHALAIKERCLGKENQGLIKNLNNLAIVYNKLGRSEEAIELRKRSEALMKARIAGADQKDIDTFIFLADKLSSEKKHAEAQEVLQQALESACSEFGEDSLKTAQVYNFMAVLAVNRGDFQEAMRRTIQGLRNIRKHHGKKHPEVAKVLRNLVLCLNNDGLFDVAQIVEAQAQAIQRSTGLEDPAIAGMRKLYKQTRDAKGERDPQTLMRLKLFSETCKMHGKTEEAEELFEEYLRILEESDSDGLELANELKMKAMQGLPFMPIIYSEEPPEVDEEEIRQSLGYLKRAVAILERSPSPNDDCIEELIENQLNIASGLALNKQFQEAEEAVARALALQEKQKGENHWSLAQPLMYYEQILKWQGKKAEAEAIEARRQALPESSRHERDEEVGRIRARLAGSLGKMFESLMGGLVEEDEDSLEEGSSDITQIGQSRRTTATGLQAESEGGSQVDAAPALGAAHAEALIKDMISLGPVSDADSDIMADLAKILESAGIVEESENDK